MKIVTVIPLKKGMFRDDLTYFTSKNIAVGNIVETPIRGKKALSLAVSVEEASILKAGLKGAAFNLKKITEDKGPSVWREEFLNAVFRSAEYFASRKSSVAAALLPAIFRENYDALAKIGKSPENADKPDSSQNIRPEKMIFQAPFDDRISFYKNMVRSSFAEKKSVFICLPTERDIEIFSSFLSRGIEKFSFSMHGGAKPKKLLENYEKIVSSSHPLLIFGTAPYLSVPIPRLGAIVVEHENSTAYKTLARPYLDMRIFAEIFAGKAGAKFILGDSMLRFESIAKKEVTGWTEIRPLSFRTNFEGDLVISQRGERKDGADTEENSSGAAAGAKFRILSDRSVRQIKESVEHGKNVFVFSLRKGLATFTVCRDCGESLSCDHCLSPVVLYVSKSGNKRMFVCNRCRSEKSPDTVCPNCGGWNLAPLGIGTDTVEEELRNIFGGKKKRVKIFKLDRETVKTGKQAEKTAKEFEESKGAILVGTELALFYLNNSVPASIIASFDSLWSIPNFRMSEKIIQLLVSIMSKTEKTLIIETKNEDSPEMRAVRSDNLAEFVRNELDERMNLGYPPYRRFIKVSYAGDKRKTADARKILGDTFLGYQPEIFSGFVPKVKDKYMTNALIKLRPESWSLPELVPNATLDQGLLFRLLALPPDYTVNVDPEDLL